MLQVVAGVVGAALFLWSISFPTLFRSAEAANLTNVSDTLSDSDVGVASNHTIAFTTTSDFNAGDQITITFDPAFTLPTGLDFNDLDVTVNSVEQTLAASNGAGTWGVATTTTTITLTLPNDSGISSSSDISIEIGTNATAGATGNTQLVNPGSEGSYEINIGGTIADTGATRVSIVNNVVVTASVDTNFTFAVAGVGTSSAVNGTSTTASSSATAIPFAQLTPGVITTLAQDLTVSTNAADGFAVTVYQDHNLQSSTGADIDAFQDGAYTDTPTAWAAPSANPNNENTWGHWGLTSEDSDLFGSNLWVAASTTPRVVFSHNSVVSASTTRVGYQAEITPLQEAGDDYSTTLTYIATPTF